MPFDVIYICMTLLPGLIFQTKKTTRHVIVIITNVPMMHILLFYNVQLQLPSHPFQIILRTRTFGIRVNKIIKRNLHTQKTWKKAGHR